LRAKRQVGGLTYAENVSVYNSGILLVIRVTQIISFACISQRMKRGLLEGAALGIAVSRNSSGWIHTDNLVGWMDPFV